MAESVQNVLLIGAAGNLGTPVIQEFLKSSFKVTVLTRESSESKFPEGVKVIRTDYSPESLEQQLKGQDVVISMLGMGGMGEQTKLIDAAVKAGVKRYIPSEFGSNTNDERVRSVVPVFAGKKGVADYLKSKESSGFSWTGVITGPFFDFCHKIGFLGFDFKNHTVKLWDGGDTQATFTNMTQIGRALVAILSSAHFTETKNKYVTIESYTVSQNETLAVVEKLSGKKWEVIERPVAKEVIPAAQEKLKQNDHSALLPLIQAATYSPEAMGDHRKVDGGLWNDRLGLPKEDFEADLKQYLS